MFKNQVLFKIIQQIILSRSKLVTDRSRGRRERVEETATWPMNRSLTGAITPGQRLML